MAGREGLEKGSDGRLRCWWGLSDVDYESYHDQEWGRPVQNDHRLFEKICLEGFQSGLSWLTILRKRENFREAFADFDFEKVATFKKRDVERLVKNAGIVRHRGKIESTINNAKRAIEVVDEFGSLASFFWQYEPDASSRPKRFDKQTLMSMSSTSESKSLSKDLKRRGWSFVGPTTAYAFMQAMGLVNDHLEDCIIRRQATADRAKFDPPRTSNGS